MNPHDKPEWLSSSNTEESLPQIHIRDPFLDLPKRVTVINEDDVMNLTIALNTAESFEQFLALV